MELRRSTGKGSSFLISSNSCFTGSGRVRALRPNLRPVMPRAGARVPPGPKFGKAGTLTAAQLCLRRSTEERAQSETDAPPAGQREGPTK